MRKKEFKYVLYGGEAALVLYEKSTGALMASDTFDFLPIRYSDVKELDHHSKESPEDWNKGDALKIDEGTYDLLYHNLCYKLREYWQSKNKNG
ncbi:hypothetical protein [Flagellimonas pacifica]|uniref:Uncharacterized protein n=1 Tax=Flagellimonas pacifica TaxID=1247520 RepID=A0A285MW82_9FLAO|nr:hypothetical protein [Allomuricauda parva]SNZ01444.1 hypothetical protein SAMN06265377_3283 [Allomuricauda parva]